jgi:hypothetical protein
MPLERVVSINDGIARPTAAEQPAKPPAKHAGSPRPRTGTSSAALAIRKSLAPQRGVGPSCRSPNPIDRSVASI